MKFEVFDKLRGALKFLLLEKERSSVAHVLKKGAETKIHYHPEAREWIVLYEGALGVGLGPSHGFKTFTAEGRVTVIEIPPGVAHIAVAFSDCEYFVVRNKADKIKYCGYLGTVAERLRAKQRAAKSGRAARKKQQSGKKQ